MSRFGRENSNGLIPVNFHVIGTGKLVLNIESRGTIATCKENLAQTLNLPPNDIRILYNSAYVPDDKPIQEICTKPNSYLIAWPPSQPDLTVREPVKPQIHSGPQPLTPEQEEIVQNLMTFGYPRTQVESALRKTKFNPDMAYQLLEMSGSYEFPVQPPPRRVQPRPVVEVSPVNPEIATVYREYTQEQKDTVIRLSQQYGVDLDTVVQLYEISGRIEEETIPMILGM